MCILLMKSIVGSSTEGLLREIGQTGAEAFLFPDHKLGPNSRILETVGDLRTTKYLNDTDKSCTYKGELF
jgi:hypothetical protein